jgi:predicted amidohydrolase
MSTKETMGPNLTIAAANFSASKVTSEGEYIQRIEQLCSDAKKQNADIVVLPEYCMLAHLAKVTDAPDFQQRIVTYAESHAEKLLEIMRSVARRTGVSLITGTMPVKVLGNLTVNRSYLVNHEGRVFHEQDKVMMTRFENEKWRISTGSTGLRIFKWRGFRCVIAVCYDIEFPYYTAQTFALNNGIDIIFVPSCTDSEHGYWRVRHCAAARAVEWQCVSVVASLVDGIAALPDMDTHYGRAAILGPCDRLFPANGCLAEAPTNIEGLAIANVELEKLELTRMDGSVFLCADQIRTTIIPANG